LDTHREALTGIGRGNANEVLRAMPKAEPVIAADMGGMMGRDDATDRTGAETGRPSAITGRDGGGSDLCS
jgi:hypothetical protein